MFRGGGAETEYGRGQKKLLGPGAFQIILKKYDLKNNNKKSAKGFISNKDKLSEAFDKFDNRMTRFVVLLRLLILKTALTKDYCKIHPRRGLKGGRRKKTRLLSGHVR